MDFFTQNSYYVVLGVVLIIWLGIFSYLVSIEKKITKLEKE
ncbi:MAG TPA: CcmD family protein [Ignavibacteria bacterium]|nr:CcmD family protein [Ignavibacteria bacterium]